jgi:hypothetical protein
VQGAAPRALSLPKWESDVKLKVRDGTQVNFEGHVYVGGEEFHASAEVAEVA